MSFHWRIPRCSTLNDCNLKCKKPLFLPVIFHNLQGYDSHLFIKQLAKVSGDLSTIPSSEEKYITFSKRITVDHYYSKNIGKLPPKKFEIRFIDSFKFLMQSKFGILSIVKLFKTITIFILQLMFFLQMFLRISEKLVYIIINSILVIIIQLLVLRGMRVSKKQNKN